MKRLTSFIAVLIPLALTADSTQTGRWYIPDYVQLQAYGSIGKFSAGPGYYLAKRKLELTFLGGFASNPYGKDFFTITGKLHYKPFEISFDQEWSTSLIYTGIYGSQTIGKNYWFWLPEKYPRDYYWWSVGFRPGIFLGTSVKKNFAVTGSNAKIVEAYFEAGTNDLYLFSYFPNKSFLSITDIIHLGFGLRLDL